MTEKITIRSDRDTDYKFMYKGEEVVLGAGKIIGIADGLEHVVLPTCAMKIMNNLLVLPICCGRTEIFNFEEG